MYSRYHLLTLQSLESPEVNKILNTDASTSDAISGMSKNIADDVIDIKSSPVWNFSVPAIVSSNAPGQSCSRNERNGWHEQTVENQNGRMQAENRSKNKRM